MVFDSLIASFTIIVDPSVAVAFVVSKLLASQLFNPIHKNMHFLGRLKPEGRIT